MKITIDRSVVEKALEALWTSATPKSEDAIVALRAALDALRGGNHRDAFVILYEELSKPGRPEPRPVTGKDSLQVAKPQRRQHRGWKCPINHFGCTRNCGNYGCGN